MLLPKFDFHEPTTVDEACQILAEYGTKAKLIAGGTDLMVNLKKKLLAPEQVVSISRVEALQGLASSSQGVKIGACFTVADIATSAVIERQWSALCAGAKALGTPLVRNRATIGGNLGSARPAADLPPSLMCYGARAVLQKTGGQRTVPLDKFFLGVGLTEIAPDEILIEIEIDAPPPYSGAGYLNLGVRKAQDCNIVNVASFLTLEGPDGPINNARIVLGCVGPTHLRSPSAEKLLIGEKPTPALFAKAGEAARQDCTPIDDFRGSAAYKSAMVGELTSRTLAIAYNDALEQ